jgi:hypothetical protein
LGAMWREGAVKRRGVFFVKGIFGGAVGGVMVVVILRCKKSARNTVKGHDDAGKRSGHGRRQNALERFLGAGNGVCVPPGLWEWGDCFGQR